MTKKLKIAIITKNDNPWVYFLIYQLQKKDIEIIVLNEIGKSERLTSIIKKDILAALHRLLVILKSKVKKLINRDYVSHNEFDINRPSDFKYVLSQKKQKVESTMSYEYVNVVLINSAQTIQLLQHHSPKYILTCGAPIINSDFLNAFDNILNCHCGIAPLYRGRSPNDWAIYYDDYNNIGYTIHKVVEKVDHGPILFQQKIPLRYKWTTEDLDWYLVYSMYTKLISILLDGSIDELIQHAEPQVGKGKAWRRIGFMKKTISQYKLNRYTKVCLSRTDYWNLLAKKNKSTGTSDYIIAAFDQRMRIEGVEYLYKKFIDNDAKRFNLLDFGCGSGDFILHFASRFDRVFGYDISEAILCVAQQRLIGFSNIVLTSSLDSISPHFDLVLSITVLQHIVDDSELIDTLRRISELCNDHAYFFALESFVTDAFPITQPAYVKARSADQWRRIFSEGGFSILETQSFYNPYLIKTKSFSQYWQRVKWHRLFYRLFRKLHLSTAILENPIDVCVDDVFSEMDNIDGFVATDSFSKFIICQKR